MKDKLLNVRVDEAVIKQLNAAASDLGRPYSQIVREAIKEKLERIQNNEDSGKPLPNRLPIAA